MLWVEDLRGICPGHPSTGEALRSSCVGSAGEQAARMARKLPIAMLRPTKGLCLGVSQGTVMPFGDRSLGSNAKPVKASGCVVHVQLPRLPESPKKSSSPKN